MKCQHYMRGTSTDFNLNLPSNPFDGSGAPGLARIAAPYSNPDNRTELIPKRLAQFLLWRPNIVDAILLRPFWKYCTATLAAGEDPLLLGGGLIIEVAVKFALVK